MEEIINHIAEEAICMMGWDYKWSKYEIAEAFNITVGELESACEFLELDIELGYNYEKH